MAKAGSRFDSKLVTRDVNITDGDYDIVANEAGSFCNWVVQTFGQAKLLAFYRSFAGADWPTDDTEAIQQVLASGSGVSSTSPSPPPSSAGPPMSGRTSKVHL